MIVNFAERAHSHNWDLDPIVRSLLDTDFYKLLMLQFIWKHYPTTRVSFSLNQSHLLRTTRRQHSPISACAALGTYPLAALGQVGIDLAGRQHLLRHSRHLRASLYRLAGEGFSPLRLRNSRARRPICINL